MEVIVKKSYPQLDPMFKVGDKLTIVANRYKEDTILVNAIHGVFDGEKMLGFYDPVNHYNYESNGYTVKKIHDPIVAKKGVHIKDYTIVTEDGREYPDSNLTACVGSNLGSFGNLFEKI